MKKIVILGAGESGTGAALLAQAKGYQVWVSDQGTIASNYKAALIEHQIPFEMGQHTWEKIRQADEIIKSPGIPDTAPIMVQIKQAGIPIIDEICFASRYTKAYLIGITGANGKTTTVHLAYYILKQAGLDVGLAGNMGKSFAKQVLDNTYAYYVLELSSFQLEYCHKLPLAIACILNITPDHLDRYDNDLSAYITAKFKILNGMDPKGYFIYNQDDSNITGYLQPKRPILPIEFPFSFLQQPLQGAYFSQKENQLHFYRGNEKLIMNLPKVLSTLAGKHNIANLLVAFSIAYLTGVEAAFLTKLLSMGLTDFKKPLHRMEWVASINQVDFYNDSKATNVAAAYSALEAIGYDNTAQEGGKKNITWIAGGYDKGNDYQILLPLVKEKVKTIICLGKDNCAILNNFQDLTIPIYQAKSMHEAVNIAHQVTKPHEVVLLSPACASFDRFKNFEDRGQQFKEAVYLLRQKELLYEVND